MSTSLGKRKRSSAAAPAKSIKSQKGRALEPAESESQDGDSQSSEPAEDPQEIFRRHFEAQFKPLPATKKPAPAPSEPDSEDEEDWDGVSEGSDDGAEEENGVQVVEHVNTSSRMAEMTKAEARAFMSSKPPVSTSSTSKLNLKPNSTIEEPQTEALNVKHDLELQRLLSESHLLSSSNSGHIPSTSLPSLLGANRLKALDMRIQTLGGKTSIHKQEKMPMNIRKGITRKAGEREDTRRKEAKENGIVLEREKRVGKKRERERGIGGPSVGRMMDGATLKLSKRDVAGIEGPKRGGSGGGRGRGRGGGRGRGRGRGKGRRD